MNLIRTKPVEDEHLNLVSYISEDDFPNKEVYSLSLYEEPGVTDSTGFLFLAAPYGGFISLPMYIKIFDVIKTKQDFEKLSSEFDSKIRQLYDAINR